MFWRPVSGGSLKSWALYVGSNFFALKGTEHSLPFCVAGLRGGGVHGESVSQTLLSILLWVFSCLGVARQVPGFLSEISVIHTQSIFSVSVGGRQFRNLLCHFFGLDCGVSFHFLCSL